MRKWVEGRPIRTARTWLAVCLLGLSTSVSAQASKDSYPSRTVRIVAPFAPGGGTDIQARMLSEKLTARLGQPVVVENRAGANGSIGMEMVARSPADGYTIIIATVGTWAVHGHLYKLSYDVQRDLEPIIHVSDVPAVLVVHPSLPVRTIKELIALGRQKRGALNYASVGIGGLTHIATELFTFMTKVEMTHVPYKGASLALTDLVGGHVHLMINPTTATIPHIQSGRLRGLATTGARRVSILSDLPTIAEAGVPGYEASSWAGIGVPARTSKVVVDRLNRELNAVLLMPDIQERHREFGATIRGGTPEQFESYLKSEIDKYGKLIKDAGIKG